MLIPILLQPDGVNLQPGFIVKRYHRSTATSCKDIIKLVVKGTVSVVSSDTACEDGNARTHNGTLKSFF